MTRILGKREINRARKRAEIVAVATRCFFQQGYGATTMSSIADNLGGSKATLWAHFASKEDLFTAVVDYHADAFAKDVEDSLIARTFSRGALREACLRFLERMLHENAISLYRLVISGGERFPEVNETFYARGPAKFRRCMVDFFATRFEEDDALRLTQLVVCAIAGYRSDILLRPVKPTRAEREAFVDDLLGSIRWPAPGPDPVAAAEPA